MIRIKNIGVSILFVLMRKMCNTIPGPKCHLDDVNKLKDIRDSVGDVLVTLIILAAQHDIELEECLKFAYDGIKDRKGVLLDGVFIRDTDPSYQGALAVLGARRVHKEG